MSLAEFKPFVGQHCAAVVRCRACGRRHTLTGRLTVAARSGQVVLDGNAYDADDFVSIHADAAERSVAPSLTWVLPYIAIACGFVSVLRLAHR